MALFPPGGTGSRAEEIRHVAMARASSREQSGSNQPHCKAAALQNLD